MMNSRIITFRLFLIVSLLMATDNCNIYCQNNRESKISEKTIYMSYGKVFSGTGDAWGNKIIIGRQTPLINCIGVDYNLAVILMNNQYYFEDNPVWKRIDISAGIEISSNLYYNIGLRKSKLFFFIGPSIRYSYEYHSRDYGIRYNHDTGEYDWFCNYDEGLGFRAGFNTGFSFAYKFHSNISIGPKVSLSYFPRNSYIFSYIGIDLIFH